MPWVGLALSIAGVVIAKKHDLRGVNSGIVGIVVPHYDSEDIESIRATLESRLSDS
jgi:hypothetical protein